MVEYNSYRTQIEKFKNDLPYKEAPFNKKNWGHKWHSISSYQGKMKPAIAHWLVNLFTQVGERVLDPLGGSGTIPFEACLQGRIGITNDLSPFAASLGASKTVIPKLESVNSEIEKMKEFMSKKTLTEDEFKAAEFGLNSPIKEYFHEETLEEILKLRIYFLENLEWTPEQNFVRANILHILHGNRPYALSRKSHSLTPYKPSGDFEYKNVIDKVLERILKIYYEPFPKEFMEGEFYFGNFNELVNKINPVDCIITSPPFVGMRFDRQNWMRMWFMGWEEQDFLNPNSVFLERNQHKDWDIYYKFFDVCEKVLKEKGRLILHLGGSEKYNMIQEIQDRAKDKFDIVDIFYENVETSERHGVKDKGSTNKHIYLFLQKK